MPRARYAAQADRNHRNTWKVIDRDTGRVILADVPGFYAKDVARDCNADAACIWLRA
jgi:hypothetical protein